jgi:hypothetical protein
MAAEGVIGVDVNGINRWTRFFIARDLSRSRQKHHGQGFNESMRVKLARMASEAAERRQCSISCVPIPITQKLPSFGGRVDVTGQA